VVVVVGWQVELGQDVPDVLADRRFRDDEGAGDGGVGAALGHQRENLALARAQPHQRVDELGHVPDPVLEQVADPGSVAGVEELAGVGRRSELALLRLTGATRRQIVWIVAAESLALTIAAVAASAAISGLVLGGLWVAFAQAAGFTPVVLPWSAIGMIAGGGALIGVVGSTLPAVTSPVFRARR
jgi:hypothetical protein